MTLQYSKQFLNDVGRLNKKQIEQLQERLLLFEKHPTDPQLNNHKLKGKLKGYCSINISGDLRAIYRIEGRKSDDVIIKFIRMNTHSELYG